MVFSSVTFLFYFLPAFLLIYLAWPRARNIVLLAFSLLFYAWGEPVYVLLMLASIVGNFVLGLRIAAVKSSRLRQIVLTMGIIGNLALLLVFKYLGFAVRTLDALVGFAIDVPDIARSLPLPIGLSFFTFQGMSYLIDVYRNHVPAERNLIYMGTYIAMFPQLVAGPIVRYSEVAQAMRHRVITVEAFAHGAWLFVLGLVSKVLLANTLAVPADAVFGVDPTELTPGAAWLGVASYTFQILFDFAGYSTMAIGLGWMTGFRLPQNFDQPYRSESLTEFWRRWHMTLSGWFRDYLYIPLGGNRLGTMVTYRNLLIVFVLCGAWHGAAWTFVVWGLWHGAFLVLERWTGFPARMSMRPLRHVYAMGVVMIGWVVFRSDTLLHSVAFLGVMFGSVPAQGHYSAALYLTPLVAITLSLAVLISTVGLPTRTLATGIKRWGGRMASCAGSIGDRRGASSHVCDVAGLGNPQSVHLLPILSLAAPL